VATALTKAHWDEPISRHIHHDFAQIRATQTAAEALDWLRTNPPKGRILYFYVVNEDGHLVGVVPARRLLLSPPEQLVAEIMVQKVVTLPATATVLEACEFFLLHRFLALPVVDEQKLLLGIVDVELYTDELSHLGDGRVRDDLFQLLGVKIAEGQGGTPLSDFRRRFPWLGCNLAAGILIAFLSSIFEKQFRGTVELSYFIPGMLNFAESVSSQSVSLALQVLHGERPSWRMIASKLRGEFTTGLMLGTGAGAVIGLVALAWLQLPWVALCLLGGVAGGVTGAALLGIALPFVLRIFRLEPRIAAGPIALAGADVITILLYLSLARWLLP
jgi:magnesium transporter